MQLLLRNSLLKELYIKAAIAYTLFKQKVHAIQIHAVSDMLQHSFIKLAAISPEPINIFPQLRSAKQSSLTILQQKSPDLPHSLMLQYIPKPDA